MTETTDAFKAKMKCKRSNEFPVPCTVMEAQGDQETEEADIKSGATAHVPAAAISLCVLEQSHI